MIKDDKDTTVWRLKEHVSQFIEEREWQKYHNPKNLAMSISIEAAELMELFQWLTIEESIALKENPAKFQMVKDEIADILAYCLSLSLVFDIDLSQAVLEKFEKNRSKYPAAKYKGRFEVD